MGQDTSSITEPELLDTKTSIQHLPNNDLYFARSSSKEKISSKSRLQSDVHESGRMSKSMVADHPRLTSSSTSSSGSLKKKQQMSKVELAREVRLQHLAKVLSKPQQSRSPKIHSIAYRLSQNNSLFSTPEQRANRESFNSGTATNDVDTYLKKNTLQDDLCNPNTPSGVVLERFNYLSVEERYLMLEQYMDKKQVFTKKKDKKKNTVTRQEQRFIRSKLSSSSIFSAFELFELDQLIQKFELIRVERGTKIITEGDTKDRRFFLIKAGRFEIRKGNKVLAQISSGVGVGELALVASGRARSATVVALEHAELYVLSHADFWDVTSLSLPALKPRAIAAIKTVPSFQTLFGKNSKLIEQVAVKLFFKRYRPGDVILRNGHAGNAFYILLSGSIVVKGRDDHYKKISSFLELTNIPKNVMTKEKATLFLEALLKSSNGSGGGGGGDGSSGGAAAAIPSEKSKARTSITEIMRTEVRVLSVMKMDNDEVDEKKKNEKIHITFEVKNLTKANVGTIREQMRESLTNKVLVSKMLEKCHVVVAGWVGEIDSPFNDKGRNTSSEKNSSGEVTSTTTTTTTTTTNNNNKGRDERNDDITLSQPGITFGERSLLTDEPVSRDIVARGKQGGITLLGGLTKQAFRQLPSSVLSMIEMQLIRQILSTHEVLAHLTEEKKSHVQSQVIFKSYKHQEYIIEEGHPVVCLFIVRSGSCDVTKLPHAKAPRSEAVKVSSNVNVNSVLGEVSLRTDKNATASVIARGPTSCYVFPKLIFDKYLRTSPYLKRLAEKRNTTNTKTVKLQSLKNLKPSHFSWEFPLVLNRELSTLQLVCHQSTGGYFACKKISIRLMEEKTKHTRLVEERQILLTIQSMFCIKLVTTFTDLRNIYMLEEFCPGGTLAGVLERPGYTSATGALTSTECGYAIGCVVLGLKCCHTHSILLRGLSPENLFIDANGIIKLGNFEFSKQLSVGQFTMTVCGTFEC